MSDWLSLPNEIQIEILQRLPSKALLRCTSVCKSWRSIITHPSFISHHLRYSNSNRFILLQLLNSNDSVSFSLRHNDQCLTHFSTFHLPTEFGSDFRLVGTCNGLLCIAAIFGGLYVCNPCIRRYVRLPEPDHYFSFCYGFGFDSVTNDYKIVRISYLTDGTSYGGRADWVEVYSLATGVWRNITAAAPVCSLFLVRFGEEAPHGYVDGVVHWGAYRRMNDRCYNFVLSFDFRDEVFREVMLPECLASAALDMDTIPVIGGGESLCVYRGSAYFCDIWVMKEYGVVESWMKLFTFNPRQPDLVASPLAFGVTLSGMIWILTPLFFRNNTELLLFAYLHCNINKRGICSLDTEKKCFTHLEIEIEEFPVLYMYPGHHAESLVLLNKPNGLVSY